MLLQLLYVIMVPTCVQYMCIACNNLHAYYHVQLLVHRIKYYNLKHTVSFVVGGGGGGGILGITLVSTPLRIWRALRNIGKHVF